MERILYTVNKTEKYPHKIKGKKSDQSVVSRVPIAFNLFTETLFLLGGLNAVAWSFFDSDFSPIVSFTQCRSPLGKTGLCSPYITLVASHHSFNTDKSVNICRVDHIVKFPRFLWAIQSESNRSNSSSRVFTVVYLSAVSIPQQRLPNEQLFSFQRWTFWPCCWFFDFPGSRAVRLVKRFFQPPDKEREMDSSHRVGTVHHHWDDTQFWPGDHEYYLERWRDRAVSLCTHRVYGNPWRLIGGRCFIIFFSLPPLSFARLSVVFWCLVLQLSRWRGWKNGWNNFSSSGRPKVCHLATWNVPASTPPGFFLAYRILQFS